MSTDHLSYDSNCSTCGDASSLSVSTADGVLCNPWAKDSNANSDRKGHRDGADCREPLTAVAGPPGDLVDGSEKESDFDDDNCSLKNNNGSAPPTPRPPAFGVGAILMTALSIALTVPDTVDSTVSGDASHADARERNCNNTDEHARSPPPPPPPSVPHKPPKRTNRTSFKHHSTNAVNSYATLTENVHIIPGFEELLYSDFDVDDASHVNIRAFPMHFYIPMSNLPEERIRGTVDTNSENGNGGSILSVIRAVCFAAGVNHQWCVPFSVEHASDHIFNVYFAARYVSCGCHHYGHRNVADCVRSRINDALVVCDRHRLLRPPSGMDYDDAKAIIIHYSDFTKSLPQKIRHHRMSGLPSGRVHAHEQVCMF